MGYWGTAISANDTYEDIYASFFDLYDKGIEPDEIYPILAGRNKDTLDDPDDNHNFWFAIAVAQWECKGLQKDSYNRVRSIVESGADLIAWRRLGASEADIRKRNAALGKFIQRISVEKPRAKARRTKKIIEPVYQKGTCLSFALDTGNYGGIITLEAVENTQYGFNLLAMTRIDQEEKPSVIDFEKSNILIRNFATWSNDPAIKWFYASAFTAHEKDRLEEVGRLAVSRMYDHRAAVSPYSFGGDLNNFLQTPAWQFAFEKQGNPPVTKLSVKEMCKQS
jgi:hypothetical protein